MSKEITKSEIMALNAAVAANWKNSVALIFSFANTHSEDALVKAIVKHGFKKTEKSNEYTCAAKLGTMIQDDNGVWTVSDQQVSRYSKACAYLTKNNQTSETALDFLKDVSLNDIIKREPSKRPSKSMTPDALSAAVKAGLFVIEEDYKAKLPGETLDISDFDVDEGENLMVVVVDKNKCITGMTLATGKPDYLDLAKDIVAAKAPKKPEADPLADAKVKLADAA